MVDRDVAMGEYRRKLLEHRERESRVKSLREAVRESKKEFEKTEDDLKALQSVGQIIGEVLRQLDEERCTYFGEEFLMCVCGDAAIEEDPSGREGWGGL